MVAQIISQNASNQPANGNNNLPLGGGVFDNSGNLIVFSSEAFNLIPGDTNAEEDIFLYNVSTNNFINLTVRRSDNTVTADPSRNPSINGNGTSVVFESRTNNLNTATPGAAGINHIYQATNFAGPTPTFTLVTGAGYDNDSFNPFISENGRWIVYETSDDIHTDLALGIDGDGTDRDIILFDTVSTNRIWVSQISDGDGLVNNGNTGFDHINPSVSRDGEYVVFQTAAPANTLIPNPPNAAHTDINVASDIFLFERATNSLRLVSHAQGNGTQAGDGASINPIISADGRYIAYESVATNLVTSDPNGNTRDIFIYEIATGNNTLISLRPDGSGTTNSSQNPSISNNGDFIAFESNDTQLVSNTDTNSSTDVFVWDRNGGTISLFSADSTGDEGNRDSMFPAISPNGDQVVFISASTDLDPSVTGQNGTTEQLFLANSTPPPTLSIDDVTVNEDAGTANLTVTLSASATADITVDYATADDSATAGTDYDANNGTLTIPAGDTQGQITVNITDDIVVEPDEQFNVNLSNSSSNATIADGEGVVTISANDSIVPISFLNDPLIRFQNSNQPGTFLFAGETEAASIRANFPEFTEEGLAFNVSLEPGEGLIRFNRFQNNNQPGTFLFATEGESVSIRSNFPNFVEEGVAFYTFGADANVGNDFIRFQNSDQPGTFLFAGQTEAVSIRANFPQFIEEGVAFEVA